MAQELGKWALIDIETTGVDTLKDEIIDIGYLQFDGLKLVKKYSSLVQTEIKLSQFIQKLTGISQKMVNKAPAWLSVEPQLLDLHAHKLLAHNSSFEQGFLERYFQEDYENIFGDKEPRETYEDSINFLGLLFPERSKLNLESFIVDFGIAESEVHRGFEDSLDLLKVLLCAVEIKRRDGANFFLLQELIKEDLSDWWYGKFFQLSSEEIETIANTIDFDVQEKVDLYFEKKQNELQEKGSFEKNFDLDFSGKNIQKILEEEDKVRKKLPSYRFRESQKNLALKVGQSFKNKVHALIQAPTGTGKTLGYLIPAVLHAKDNQEQILIATGTKALQNQAIEKDVPQLRKLLGLGEDELKISTLIGSSNHLCELKFRSKNSELDLFNHSEDFDERFAKVYFQFIFHLNSQGEKPITRENLSFVLKKHLPAMAKSDEELAVDFRVCTGSKCPYKGSCSYINGLREAKDSDVVIGNHSLMFSWPKGFPRPAYVVVDEAHKIEGEATSAYSLAVNEDSLGTLYKQLQQSQGIGALYYLLGKEGQTENQQIISKIRAEVQNAASVLADHLVSLPDLIETYFKLKPRYSSLYWNELPMVDKSKLNDKNGIAIFNHLESIHFVLADLAKTLSPYLSMWSLEELKEDNDMLAFTTFEAFATNITDICEAINAALNPTSDYVSSLKYHESYGYSLEASPIDVGKKIHETLLETSHSVVFTSATLSNSDGSKGTVGVEWLTGYLYLEAEKRFKNGFYLPAQFDYKKNSKVFICDDTKNLYDNMFVEDTLKEVFPLVRKIGGRTLLLFSAKTRFEIARELLIKEFEGEIPLFIQGMGVNVVEDFKNSKSGILLGMEKFGEGIDVPGETLQFIFIDKIPDIRQDLVINQRRQYFDDHFGNEFSDYFLAHRARSLHQKLGRLLRTEQDFGGAIIVDARIKKWKTRTKKQFFDLMKPYEIHNSNLKDACINLEEFLEQKMH